MKVRSADRSWIWMLIVIGGLWGAWYWYENQPSRVRAGLEGQLREIDQERRSIHADRIRRADEDRALHVDVGRVDRETAALLFESERLAREIDDQRLRALAERQRQIEQRLAAMEGR